jgi:hypothetical protein
LGICLLHTVVSQRIRSWGLAVCLTVLLRWLSLSSIAGAFVHAATVMLCCGSHTHADGSALPVQGALLSEREEAKLALVMEKQALEEARAARLKVPRLTGFLNSRAWA